MKVTREKVKRLLKLLFRSAGFSILFGSLFSWLWIFNEIRTFGYVYLTEPNVFIWLVEVLLLCYGILFTIRLLAFK